MKIIKFTALALMLVIAFNVLTGCVFLSGILGDGDTDNTGEENSNEPNTPEKEDPDNNLPEQEDPDDNKIPEPEGPNESVLLWQAEIYDYVNNNVNPEFAENNKIKVAYEYNDPERENAPDSLTFIINDREAFYEAFAIAPFEVNFENETVLLYTYTPTTATPYVINNILVDEHTHTVSIDIKLKHVNSSPTSGDACEPTQSWLAVKMKKVNATEVEFY